jgi:hypothetical protein
MKHGGRCEGNGSGDDMLNAGVWCSKLQLAQHDATFGQWGLQWQVRLKALPNGEGTTLKLGSGIGYPGRQGVKAVAFIDKAGALETCAQ